MVPIRPFPFVYEVQGIFLRSLLIATQRFRTVCLLIETCQPKDHHFFEYSVCILLPVQECLHISMTTNKVHSLFSWSWARG